MKHPLFIHASGPDASGIAAAFAKWPWYGDLPGYLDIDDRERKITPAWRDQLPVAKRQACADWNRLDRSPDADAKAKVITVLRSSRLVMAAAPDAFSHAEEVLELLVDLPFELASFRTVWPIEWKKLDAPRIGFGEQHAFHGWACAFRGAGHDRLVSRRWLDHGPWRVLRSDGDLTLIQFHDLDASAKQALAQAIPAHQRMGISDTGGFIQTLATGRTLEGLYDADTRTLEIVIAGRKVTQPELLEACAIRRSRRTDREKPIERIAYVFVSDAEAHAHLHELWLRELECWSVEGGAKHRLDLDYQPKPAAPAWV